MVLKHATYYKWLNISNISLFYSLLNNVTSALGYAIAIAVQSVSLRCPKKDGPKGGVSDKREFNYKWWR